MQKQDEQHSEHLEEKILQENINDFIEFFEGKKETIQLILDDIFTTWSWEHQDSGTVQEVYNEYIHAYLFLKRIVNSMRKTVEPEPIYKAKVRKFVMENRHLKTA